RAGRRPEAGGESQSMVVLGIDPGLASTGYGVVESRQGALAARDRGVIETRAAAPQERRLADLHAGGPPLPRDHEPHAVATTSPTGWRWRSCPSAPTCAPPSPWGTRAASPSWPPASAACHAPATPPSR